MSDSIEKIKCLIIGSGPAGYTAAIYASRADLHPVMYTGMQPGGQLTTTTEVDNFPGYPDGTDGNAMMIDLQNQAERFGTEVRFGMVTSIELSNKIGGIHKVIVDNKTEIEAETVIISTGATAKYLGLESEQRLIGGGVSANSGIRAALKQAETQQGWDTFVPAFEYTTDNAAMIAIVGYLKYLEGDFADQTIMATARLKL